MDRPTLLIDCHFIGHQAHYTLGGLSHGDVATGVVYGFLSRVLFLGQQFKTNDIVFCWDSIHSYRRRKYQWYKANRRTRDPEEQESLDILHRQLRVLRKDILPKIGFANQLIQDGCESDDMMAVVSMGKLGDFVLVTADEDLYQCLRPNVSMYNPNKRRLMTEQRFREEYGIAPGQWVFVKAVAGCPSDNVKGIQGVGVKTVLKYLQGTLGAKTKAYAKIVNNDGVAIRERNKPIVRLPISTAREPKLNLNTFSKSGFQMVCEQYGLESFLEPEKASEWHALFDGRFETTSPRRAPRRHRAQDYRTDESGFIDGM